jgi:hypothetical protein
MTKLTGASCNGGKNRKADALLSFLARRRRTDGRKNSIVVIGRLPRRDSVQDNIAVLYEQRVNFRWTELALGGSALACILGVNLLASLQPRRRAWQLLKPAMPMLMSIVGILVVVIGKFKYWPDSPFRTVVSCCCFLCFLFWEEGGRSGGRGHKATRRRTRGGESKRENQPERRRPPARAAPRCRPPPLKQQTTPPSKKTHRNTLNKR